MESQTSSSAGLKPGDLVEIHRTGYKHWGVYIGDGFIVHVTAPDGIPKSVTGTQAVVKKEKLAIVAGGDKWNISNHLDEKYQPRPADDIVKAALWSVGQMVPYGTTFQNCVDFFKYLLILGQVVAAISSVIKWTWSVLGY